MLASEGRVADRIPTRHEFTGPATGSVELPIRLCWSGDPVFDVNDSHQRLTLYTTLLGEGKREDLARWIHWALLVADWPKIRRLTSRDLISTWETLLPALAAR
jgi:hypothetical protein